MPEAEPSWLGSGWQSKSAAAMDMVSDRIVTSRLAAVEVGIDLNFAQNGAPRVRRERPCRGWCAGWRCDRPAGWTGDSSAEAVQPAGEPEGSRRQGCPPAGRRDELEGTAASCRRCATASGHSCRCHEDIAEGLLAWIEADVLDGGLAPTWGPFSRVAMSLAVEAGAEPPIGSPCGVGELGNRSRR